MTWRFPLSPFWKHLVLFVGGAALCVLGYLFLLNLPALGPRSSTAGLVPVLFLAITTSWLTSRLLRADSIPPAALGLTASVQPFVGLGVGFLSGCALVGVWFTIVTTASGATWHLNPGFRGLALLGACAFALFNNIGEELIYRGYAFVRLAERYSPAVALVTTSSLFALLHLQAGLPWLSVLAGVLTSGLVFGAIFARWRSLPLALGFHVATNIAQNTSGLRLSAASVLAPAFPPQAAAAGSSILAGIALVNLLLTIGILIPAHRPVARGAA